jgi:Fe-S-cluster containining protein
LAFPRGQEPMSELQTPNQAAEFAFNITTKTLKRSTDVDSCVALASKVDEQISATFSHATSMGAAPVACKAGCSFCCHLRVTITPYEAIALFRYLRTKIPGEQADVIASKVLANAERIGAITEADHRSARIQCAFLVDGRCSAYSARPAVCAAYHSMDRNECEAQANEPYDVSNRIPMLTWIQQMHGAMEQGISNALKGLKLNGESTELHTAVAVFLRDPTLIAKWRSGRPLPKKGSNG